MIRADRLSKRYGSLRALEGLSFEVAPGEVLGFLGPNGAGKTTALRILASWHPPTSGHAAIAGHDVVQDSLAARRALGYLPEHFTAPHELRVGEYLVYRARLKGLGGRRGRERARALAAELGLAPRWRQPFATLSKGYRQRVGLADALLADPPALVLDEPLSGLDPLQRQEIKALLRGLAARGKAVLLSSHVLPEVEAVADRVLVLDRGRTLALGTLAELRARVRARSPLRVVLAAADPDAVAALEEVAARLGARVEAVPQRPTDFRLHLDDPARRSELFRALGAADLDVVEFHTEEADLEELFLRLVGDADAAAAGEEAA